MKKLLQYTLFPMIILALIYCAGCSQLRRAERDIIGNIPGVERIEWTIKGEVIGAAHMECAGYGATLVDAIEAVSCRSLAPETKED